jgi:predicted NAD-dependent protein-ADP-ribosyltransferase YbiA (DUF1768 family)
MITISSGMAYPGGHLSNLYPHRFTFDGIRCASIESLLQSFKTEEIEVQKQFCKLNPYQAKMYGKYLTWQDTQTLWWNGTDYRRDSAEYQTLLMSAYTALAANKNFKKALLDTGDEILVHPIGGKTKSKTILTGNEFCNILEEIRENLK